MTIRTFLRNLGHEGLHRPRLLAAAAAGVLAWVMLPGQWAAAPRVLLAWNIGVWPYLVSMAWLMLRCAPERVRTIAEQENASSVALLVVMSSAAVLSVVAIVAELAQHPAARAATLSSMGLPMATVAGSWFLVGVIYTFHYAHLFYEAPARQRPLAFPEQLQTPSYRDFLYFAFTISATAQTSDVTVMSTSMRGAVLAQSVLSFFFNVAILGLSINIAAAAVGTAGA